MRSTVYLADTNVLSELFKPQPDAGVVAWAEGVPLICISAVTFEELYYGLAWKPNQRIQERLETFLDEFSEPLPVTAEIARLAGQLRGDLQREGISRSQADLIIGATASVHQLTLVTRNVSHFTECQIPLLDPFSP